MDGDVKMVFDPSTAKAEAFDPSTAMKPLTPPIPEGYEEVEPEEKGDFSIGGYALGALDSLGTMATGATGGAVGFVSGALEQLTREILSGNYGTIEAANRVKESALSNAAYWTHQPMTEEGQEIVGKIGEIGGQIPIAPQMAAYQPLMRNTAFQMSQKAGQFKDVLSRKFGRNMPLIDENNLPAPPLQKALKKYDTDYSLILSDPDSLPTVSSGSADDVVKNIIKKRIRNGSDNATLYNKRLEGDSIVPDPLGDEAVKQGFRPGQVSSAKNANKPTKKIMQKMLELKRVIESSEDKAIEQRPSYFIGDVVMDRVKVLRDKSLELRNDLSNISKRFKTEKTEIDTTGIQDTFFKQLENAEINIPDEAYQNPTILKDLMKNKSFFDGSDIAKDVASQKVIRDITDLLSQDGSGAYRAHKLKRQIDTMIDYKQKTYGGLTDTGKNFAKSIRASLNDAVREVSTDYAKTNDQLTNIFTSLEGIREKLPKKIDFDDPRAVEAMGQELRKYLTNYASRNELINAVNSVDSLASDYAGQNPIQLNRLIVFNNTLDDRFIPSARGSFKGEIRTSTDRSIDVTQMASKTAALNKAANTLVESLEKFKNINDQEAFNSMQRLLTQE